MPTPRTPSGAAESPAPAGPRAVVLGGGHGLQASLAALCRMTERVTAVVTVADDGGSSGRLRKELGLLPPGDLRKAFEALLEAEFPGHLRDSSAGGQEFRELWSRVLGYRFGGQGQLAGHAIGNLLLAGLFETAGDSVHALDRLRELFALNGRVLPMSRNPLDIEAEVRCPRADSPHETETRTIRGQAAVATTPGRVTRTRLFRVDQSQQDAQTAPQACAEAVSAVQEADLVVLGPGSWFTSVLPHLQVPELHEALVTTSARRAVVLNLVPQAGETSGFSAHEHLDVLCEHAPELRVDWVLADVEAVAAGDTPDRLRTAAARLGAHTVLDKIASPTRAGRHDPAALAASLAAVWNAESSFHTKGRGGAPRWR